MCLSLYVLAGCPPALGSSIIINQFLKWLKQRFYAEIGTGERTLVVFGVNTRLQVVLFLYGADIFRRAETQRRTWLRSDIAWMLECWSQCYLHSDWCSFSASYIGGVANWERSAKHAPDETVSVEWKQPTLLTTRCRLFVSEDPGVTSLRNQCEHMYMPHSNCRIPTRKHVVRVQYAASMPTSLQDEVGFGSENHIGQLWPSGRDFNRKIRIMLVVAASLHAEQNMFIRTVRRASAKRTKARYPRMEVHHVANGY